MSRLHAYFDLKNPNGDPNYDALKLQLGSLRGVVAMDIDSRAHGVSVVFEDSLLSKKQIALVLKDVGYELSNAHHA